MRIVELLLCSYVSVLTITEPLVSVGRLRLSGRAVASQIHLVKRFGVCVRSHFRLAAPKAGSLGERGVRWTVRSVLSFVCK